MRMLKLKTGSNIGSRYTDPWPDPAKIADPDTRDPVPSLPPLGPWSSCDLDLWPKHFDPNIVSQNVSALTVWRNSVQKFSRNRINKAKKCILRHVRPTVTSNYDLVTRTRSVHPCPKMHQLKVWWKCAKYFSRYCVREAQTDRQTDRHSWPAGIQCFQALWWGGIKI